MNDIAIQVRGIGKQYRIGHQVRSNNIREAFTTALTGVFRRMRQPLNPAGEETFWALKDVSFDVKRGEVVGVIGRNGAGKSTLLKILSRITDPTEGEAIINGRVGSLLEVGTGFHSELTGRENVYLNGAILGMKRGEIDKKFDEIVAFSEVEKFLDTPVKHYSSGMYMRLAFAVAAHLDPEILIVDEVLAVGDAGFQKKCLGKMKAVAGEGRTVLFVSHNMAAISNLCSQGILLGGGKKIMEGGIDGVVQKYSAVIQGMAVQDLTKRTDRQGHGKVRFNRVWLETPDGQKKEYATSGQPVVIAMSYEGGSAELMSNVRASIAVNDSMGQALILFSTELTTDAVLNLPSTGVLRCLLPSVPLGGSEYFLTTFIEVNGIVQDFVSNAATFTVEDGDFYGHGKLFPPGWRGKGVLVNHQWLFPGQGQARTGNAVPAATVGE